MRLGLDAKRKKKCQKCENFIFLNWGNNEAFSNRTKFQKQLTHTHTHLELDSIKVYKSCGKFFDFCLGVTSG